MRVLILGFILVVANAARADVKPHVEASVWPGYVWGESMSAGFSDSISAPVIDLRGALGVAWFSASGVTIRGGAVVDGFLREPFGIAGGLEIQADVDFAPWPGWRIGGRLAGLVGDGDGSPAVGHGQSLVPGVRLRNGSRFFGIDGIFVRTGDGVSHGYANGFMFGAGVSGKPGGVIVGSAAAITGLFALGLLIAFGGSH